MKTICSPESAYSPLPQNSTRNAMLLAIPMGQFQGFWRATSHTQSAPVTKPATSMSDTCAP